MQQKVWHQFLHTNVVRSATLMLHSRGHTKVLRLRMQHLLQINEQHA